METEGFPDPPILSCDSKKYTLRSSLVRSTDDLEKYEPKTPKDLPGDPKKYIDPGSFFPYDASSTKSITPTAEDLVGGFESIETNPDRELLSRTPKPKRTTPRKSKTSVDEVQDEVRDEVRDENEVQIPEGLTPVKKTPSPKKDSPKKDSARSLRRLSKMDSVEENEDIVITQGEPEEIFDMEFPKSPNNTPLISPVSSRLSSPVKMVMSEEERRLLDHKFTALKTFILKNMDETMIYLIQVRSYYGDTFMLKFNQKTIMSEDKIFLYETNTEEPTFIISETMTNYLYSEPDLVTLFNDSLMFEGSVYTSDRMNLRESLQVYHPSSYKVFTEHSVKDPSELAIKAHTHALKIETVYREELADSYNTFVSGLAGMIESVQDHHDLFKDVDSCIIAETDKYYDKFVKNISSGRPIPSNEDINRITFLNETSLKYIQTHFIFWNRLQDRLNNARKEFEDTIKNIYLQMVKDFPNLEGIPLPADVDIERSYPGRIFSKL